MKGLSSIIDTVLIAAATLLFMMGLINVLNDFTTRVSTERTRAALVIDSQKVINSILLARREIGDGNAKFFVSLADFPYDLYVQNGYLIAKSSEHTINTSLFNMANYITFNGKIKNSKGQKPYIISSGNTITFGVE